MNRPTKAHMDQIRVLIVDDHTTVLAGLTAIIGMQPDMVVVAEAANGIEALGLWQMHRPDITLLDLRMPKMDGVSLLNEIRQRDQSARVIVLTTYDSDLDILRAVKAGAKGYLLKDARREELLDCIRKVNSGETRIPPALMQKLVTGRRMPFSLISERQTAQPNSPKEFKNWWTHVWTFWFATPVFLKPLPWKLTN